MEEKIMNKPNDTICNSYTTITELLTTDLEQEKRLNEVTSKIISLELEVDKLNKKVISLVLGGGVILTLLVIDVIVAVKNYLK